MMRDELITELHGTPRRGTIMVRVVQYNTVTGEHEEIYARLEAVTGYYTPDHRYVTLLSCDRVDVLPPERSE